MEVDPVLMSHKHTLTGNVPGIAASKADTQVLGGAANFTAAPENNFDFELICA